MNILIIYFNIFTLIWFLYRLFFCFFDLHQFVVVISVYYNQAAICIYQLKFFFNPYLSFLVWDWFSCYWIFFRLFLVARSIRIIIFLDMIIFSNLTIINHLIISWATRWSHLLSLQLLRIFLLYNKFIKITHILINSAFSFKFLIVQLYLNNFFFSHWKFLLTNFSYLVHTL